MDTVAILRILKTAAIPLVFVLMLSPSLPASAALNTWTSAGNAGQARQGHTATLLVTGKVLIAGGHGSDFTGTTAFADVQEYDPATGVWSPSTNLLGAGRHDHTATTLASGTVLLAGGVDGLGAALNSAVLYAPSHTQSLTAGGMSAARAYHTATLLPSGKVLVVGGSNAGVALASAELYDPDTGAWSSAGALANARSAHTATLLRSGKVLVIGGNNSGGALVSAEIYDPASNSWSTAGNLATARGSHTATMLPSGQVLVAGGATSTFGWLASAELFNPATNSFAAVASMSAQRLGHSATLLRSGQVLVAGGFSAQTSAELYDPASGVWTAITNRLLGARFAHTATLLQSGQVLLVAGASGTGGVIASSETYDPPLVGSWRDYDNLGLGTARYGHTATPLLSGGVLVAGGADNAGHPMNKTELFENHGYTWSAAGNLAIARYFHTATLLPLGKVLVVGGANASGSAIASAELYDPATDRWSSAGALAMARVHHTATLLPSGKVLIAGGGDFDASGGNPIASAELYDPTTNSWSAAGSMRVAHSYHTATMLPNGKVLIAGGTYPDPPRPPNSVIPNPDVAPSNDAELYDPATSAWSYTSSLRYPRQLHSATLLPSGKVLVVGGESTGNSELYDSVNGNWSPAGPAGPARFNHVAILLRSGKVLIAGGNDFGGHFLTDTQIYDPAVNVAYTNYYSLNAARGLATATPVFGELGGQILVVGGQDNNGLVGSGELYSDVDFAYARQPVVTGGTFSLGPQNAYVQLSGSQFEGDSEAGSGASNGSSGNYPLLQLRRIDNGQVTWETPTPEMRRSDSTYVGALLPPGTPYGPYLLTMFVNAVPSDAVVIQVLSPSAIPRLLSSVSRKKHVTAGEFDLQLGTGVAVDSHGITVEPRGPEPGGVHRLIFNFDQPIMSVGAVRLDSAASSALPEGSVGTPVISGSSVLVSLSGVPDRKRLQVTLSNVNGTGINASTALGFLLGDVTQDRQVTGLDAALAAVRSPSAVTSANFLYNVSLSGSINALDKAVVSANAPKALE